MEKLFTHIRHAFRCLYLPVSFLGISWLPLFAYGQTPAPASGAPPLNVAGHPKIGLVLDGGGALGLAHIGVIQWLEEHRIP